MNNASKRDHIKIENEFFFSSCLSSPIRREKLAIAIETESYIKKIVNVFHVCEELDNTAGLHHLFEIVRNIFLLVSGHSKGMDKYVENEQEQIKSKFCWEL
jgi:hypothetical protein